MLKATLEADTYILNRPSAAVESAAVSHFGQNWDSSSNEEQVTSGVKILRQQTEPGFYTAWHDVVGLISAGNIQFSLNYYGKKFF